MLNSRRRVLRNSFYTEGTLGGGSSLRTPRGGSGISRSTSDAEKRRTMIAELPAEDMALFRDETDAPQRLSVGHIAGSRSGKTVVDNRRIGGHVQSLVRANHSLQKNRKRVIFLEGLEPTKVVSFDLTHHIAERFSVYCDTYRPLVYTNSTTKI